MSIEAAVAEADVPVLLVAVAHHTGDFSLLRDGFRPDSTNLFDPDAGLTPEIQADARAAAAEALRRHQETGAQAAPPLTDDQLFATIAFLAGEDAARSYGPILREELALEGTDPRAPTWHKDDIAVDVAWSVAVIGAGMSGLAVAHRLLQAGVPVTILEKNADVGGTWLENIYPGCRVDVPSHLYSYSFAQSTQWPGFFSDQESLLSYFRQCADDLGLREHIRFGAEVVSATFDDDRQLWQVVVRSDNGEETLEFNAVCSAVGQLNRPSFPAIEGRESFAGESFHSAQWDYGIDLTNKRVAIIGTGASAAQFIPAVGEQAGELVVFQRTAPWLAPTPNYHDSLPEGVRFLLTYLPQYVRWDRLWLFWRMHEGLLPAARVDPDWKSESASVSPLNEMVRLVLTEYLRTEFPEDELFQKIVPNYPPIAKRIVRDNGIYARTLRRDNVDLVVTPIECITPDGIRTVDGTERSFDVIVYGTGFQASNFLFPMKVTGRDGIEIHDRWDGDARAYLGITVPGFPNLFMLYGPNTNIVINGSIIFFTECEAHYIVESMRLLLEGGYGSLDVKPDVHDAYNAGIDEENRAMAWGASTVNTWYKNAKGRITQNWPYSLLEYWQRTRETNPDDYVLR
jgi:4-hydroxyacetophenone monooxygenase